MKIAFMAQGVYQQEVCGRTHIAVALETVLHHLAEAPRGEEGGAGPDKIVREPVSSCQYIQHAGNGTVTSVAEARG